MNINPISFGRGIALAGPKRVAEQIQGAVNKKQYSPNMKALKEFATPIFHDANILGGGVEVFSISSDSHYLFSGEEAKKAREIIENTRYNCQKNTNGAKRAAMSDGQLVEYEAIAQEANKKLIEARNQKLQSLLETKQNTSRNSLIYVRDYEEYLDGDLLKQKGIITYSSCTNQIRTESKFKFNA